jgi:hypothetical protein
MPINLSVRPAPGGRLSDGLVVDASIQARLLGLRILKLDAQIKLVPASYTIDLPAEPLMNPSSGDLPHELGSLAGAARTLDRVTRKLRPGRLG